MPKLKQKLLYFMAGFLILPAGLLSLFHHQRVEAKPVVDVTAPLNLPIPTGNITLPILMYHHVGSYPTSADATRKDLTVPTANFEQQVSWLSSQGYHSITLEQFYLYTQGKFRLPSKPIIFTFDDGYE